MQLEPAKEPASSRRTGADEPSRPVSRSQVKYRLVIDEFGGWDRYQELLAELARIGAAHGVDAATVAMRFVLEQSAVAAVICGATRMGQMERNARSFGFALTESDHEALRALLDRAPGPEGPVFGLERDREGPHGRIMRYDLNR